MSNLARQQPLEPSMKYKFVCVVFTLQLSFFLFATNFELDIGSCLICFFVI